MDQNPTSRASSLLGARRAVAQTPSGCVQRGGLFGEHESGQKGAGSVEFHTHSPISGLGRGSCGLRLAGRWVGVNSWECRERDKQDEARWQKARSPPLLEQHARALDEVRSGLPQKRNARRNHRLLEGCRQDQADWTA